MRHLSHRYDRLPTAVQTQTLKVWKSNNQFCCVCVSNHVHAESVFSCRHGAKQRRQNHKCPHQHVVKEPEKLSAGLLTFVSNSEDNRKNTHPKKGNLRVDIMQLRHGSESCSESVHFQPVGQTDRRRKRRKRVFRFLQTSASPVSLIHSV